MLARIAARDESAFTELYRRYSSSSMGLAMRVIGERMFAEEVVQEVFVSLWRSAGGFDPRRGRVRSWLMTQVHHRSVDLIRREQAHRRRSTPAVTAGDHADDVVEESWLAVRRDHVRSAVGSLSSEHQQVLALAYFDGLTQVQISERTGVPLGTVKTRTLAAMRELRRVLPGDDR